MPDSFPVHNQPPLPAALPPYHSLSFVLSLHHARGPIVSYGELLARRRSRLRHRRVTSGIFVGLTASTSGLNQHRSALLDSLVPRGRVFSLILSQTGTAALLAGMYFVLRGV